MQFGDHDRKQVEHDDNDQGIECKFMHRDERFAERAHRLVRRFVDQVSGTRLKRSRINSGSSDPLHVNAFQQNFAASRQPKRIVV